MRVSAEGCGSWLQKEGDKRNRILVCTHSNSAADLYIREYLDPYITSLDQDTSGEQRRVKLVRVYYRNRWVTTVSQVVQKYCLIDSPEETGTGSRSFRNPSLADVEDCDVVVATLSTSRYLSGLGLPKGHFTHILIDEAAQVFFS